MKCNASTTEYHRSYDRKTKAMISVGAGGMSALFGSGLLYANPSWTIALLLLGVSLTVALTCFVVPWCATQTESTTE
ncbi:MAG: hypothetical protein FJ308_16340 [Planctomycetes bacterium]|nr:hypothetical protein [Planctomycetota bacterium]